MKAKTVLNRLGLRRGADRPSDPSDSAPRPGLLGLLVPGGTAEPSPAALVAAGTSAALLERIQAEALKEVGTYGFGDGEGDRYRNWGARQQFQRAPDVMEDVMEYSRPMECRAPIEAVHYSINSMSAVNTKYAVASPPVEVRAPQEGVDFSATNIQEAGVDEPDIVKTDGRRILAVGDGRLWYVDVAGEKPELRSSLELPNGQVREMFMSGDRALLLLSNPRNGYDERTWDYLGGYRRRALASVLEDLGRNVFPYWTSEDLRREVDRRLERLIRRYPRLGWNPPRFLWGKAYQGMAALIDVSDPERMAVIETLQVSGEYVSARMVGERVTAVFTYHSPSLPGFVDPSYFEELDEDSEEEPEDLAEERNRQVIRESSLADWVPSYRLERGDDAQEGLFVDCSFAYTTQDFSGRDMVSVLTLDMNGSFDPGAVTTVMTGEQNVRASSRCIYASSRSLYVTAEQRPDGSEEYSTNIHKFDLTGPDRARYAASGTVDGFLLNQFAMSEHEGYLRVATTNKPARWWSGAGSESRVDVLADRAGRLRLVGSVGGLGKEEQIYAVRFMGKIGYVVTFRETDPLYTIDLSDPTAPRAAGELKILGYSSYLHPLEEGLLLGVGQDADERGWTSGTQVSVFDVSDLDHPRRTAQFTLEGASSEAEDDHRAFLYWAPENLVVIPVNRGWRSMEGVGALALEVSKDRVRPRDRLRDHASIRQSALGEPEHRYWRRLSLLRSVVVGDSLYTMSDGGLACHDLASLRETCWVEFSEKPAQLERERRMGQLVLR